MIKYIAYENVTPNTPVIMLSTAEGSKDRAAIRVLCSRVGDFFITAEKAYEINTKNSNAFINPQKEKTKKARQKIGKKTFNTAPFTVLKPFSKKDSFKTVVPDGRNSLKASECIRFPPLKKTSFFATKIPVSGNPEKSAVSEDVFTTKKKSLLFPITSFVTMTSPRTSPSVTVNSGSPVNRGRNALKENEETRIYNNNVIKAVEIKDTKASGAIPSFFPFITNSENSDAS